MVFINHCNLIVVAAVNNGLQAKQFTIICVFKTIQTKLQGPTDLFIIW